MRPTETGVERYGDGLNPEQEDTLKAQRERDVDRLCVAVEAVLRFWDVGSTPTFDSVKELRAALDDLAKEKST